MKLIRLWGLVSLILLSMASARAQVSLTTTSYTENFDGLGTVPNGTTPTSTNLVAGFRISPFKVISGTATNQATGVIDWNQLATWVDNAGIVASGSLGTWNNSDTAVATGTDRSLQFRANRVGGTGTYDGPRNLIFAFVNNTGSNISSLTLGWEYVRSADGRINTTISFFHGNNTTWTAVAAGDVTYTAAGAFAAVSPAVVQATVTGLTINNLTIPNGSTYYLRWQYATATATSSSAEGAGLGIDNFTINAAPAAITATPSSLSGFSTTFGTASAAQTFTVGGSALTSQVTVAAPTGYEVSLDGTTYAASVNVAVSAGAPVANTVRVRIASTAAVGAANGNITLSSTGAPSQTVALTGTVGALVPTVTSPTSTSITATGATLGGNVTADGGATITERGVVYSLTSANNDPLIGGTGVTKVTGTGTTGVFTVAATGLANGSGYSFKAYAINAQGTTYTTVSTFTTLSVAPTVTSPTSTAITATGATLGGNVTADGGATITERGVVYALTSANNDPLINGTGVTKVTGTGTTGVFTVSATGLANGSGYSFKAYAINAQGTTYTTVATFTTAADTATVSSVAASSITGTTATLGGNVTADGGASVTAKGVVYSLNSQAGDPAISGTGVTQLVDGTGTGSYTVSATSLTPGTTYKFRAYAVNSAGTSYGAVTTFTTLNNNADIEACNEGPSNHLIAGTLSPAFNSATTSYSIDAVKTATHVHVAPTLADANATYAARINGGAWSAETASGVQSPNLNLNVGINTVNIRVTAQDGVTTKTYTLTVDRLGNVKQWRFDRFATKNNNGNAANDTILAGDGLSNITKYAYGLEPAVPVTTSLAISGSTLTARGKPTVFAQKTASGVRYTARHVRKKTHVEDGLAITVRFSADLVTWQTNTTPAVTIASDADYDCVEVPYPLSINGRKTGYFQVLVGTNE